MVLILTTTDSRSVASKIGKNLLKEKLIACYSVFPVESSYWWKSKIVNSKEFQIILKTKADKFLQIEKRIKELHTYDLPEVISIKVENAGKDYKKWIGDSIS